ncbi:MAG: thiamine phosphate synthase [Sulfurimonas sp.]|jgi:thiamine-phosphate pyrophosphorylase|nr:thiamine phosphate synthase [Sulfurimonas sp.]MBU1216146.1 thiamine phosphate synthase [bacterium]MBU1434452.1 thiamine phosphate synthase [bacterium]MBU1502030.1 thiamine phosphate synthase [bacterium]MBU3939253.1 thiamine phosphate synthase [bacterium]
MRLYALCDQDMLDNKGISLEEYVNLAKANAAEIIQYRNKTADVSFIKQQLIKIRKMYDGFLIVNDKYELIEFCDGVHLGQEDLKIVDEDVVKAAKIIRSVVGADKILGLSTHSEEEVNLANEMDLNYIGLGAFRTTDTKKNISTVLGDSLDVIASKSKHYVAAIGGVKKSDNFTNVTYHVIGSGLL